jgi:hypothetical protein
MTRKLKGTCRLTLIIRREIQLNKQAGLRAIKGWTERDSFSQSYVHYCDVLWIVISRFSKGLYVEFTRA